MRRQIALCLMVCLLGSIVCSCGQKKAENVAPSAQMPTMSASENPSTQTPTKEPESSASLEATMTPIPQDDAPDVLKLVLNVDGTFANALEDPEVVSYGADKVISYDDQIGMNVATFTGTRDVYTVDLQDWVSVLSDTFTIEIFFKLTEFRVDTTHLPIVSTAEGGGFAIELAHGEQGVLQYVVNLDAEYQKVTTNVELNKWYHMVGVWDGNYIILYVDGVKVGEYDSEWGFMMFPTASKNQFLTIGGDTHVYPDETLGGPGAAFQLGICNMYATALTASQVQTIYQGLK